MAHVLPEEVWLKIISYLDLRSKLRAACTCTCLRRIVKDPSLWSKINLTNRPDTERDSRFPSLNSVDSPPIWTFPGDEGKVMEFAHSYFSEKLKILHLNVLNTDILKYIHDTCVSLESLMLYHNNMSLRNCNLSFLPPSVKTLDMCLTGCFTERPNRRVHYSAQIPCNNFDATPLHQLHCLTIRYTTFSSILFERLSMCSSLCEIIFHHCKDLQIAGFTQLAKGVPNLSSLWLRYSSCLGLYCGAGFGNYDMFELLSVIPELFTKLCSLKIQFIMKNEILNYYQDDRIPNALLLTLSHLRSLWLENTDMCLPDNFITLTTALKELRELELINHDNVTTDVLFCLSLHLTHLYRLVLKDCKNVTDAGIRALANHSSLKYFNIQGCREVSSRAIQDTVLTIPTMQILVISERASDEFDSCITDLMERMPHLTVHPITGP